MRHARRLMLLITLILASIAAAFYTWRTQDSLEGFQDDEASAVLADGGEDYSRRMHVMKLFDALLKRKATSGELDEFANGTDAEILQKVLDRVHPKDAGESVDAGEEKQMPTPTQKQKQKQKGDVVDVVATPPRGADSRQQLLEHLREIVDKAALSHAILKVMV